MELGTRNGFGSQTVRRDRQSRKWTHRCIRTCLLAALLIPQMTSSAPASGGDLVWELGDPQAGDQEAVAMALDSTGNLIITGHEDIAGNLDFYTVKFASDGASVIWNEPYDHVGGEDRASSVTTDSNQDVVVAGYVWNGANVDFGTIKYNAVDGTVATGWPQIYGAPASGNDYATAVTVDGSDNVYVAGYGQSATSSDDYILAKYAPDGTPDWQVSYNGPGNSVDRAFAVASGGGGIVVVGESQSAGLDFDCAIVKYNSAGGEAWTQRRSDLGNDTCDAVHIDPFGDVIIAGRSFNGNDWDMFVEKRAGADGALIWDFTRDSGYSEELHGIATDSSGDVYVTGHAFLVATSDDVYTAKFDSALGTLLWSDTHNTADGNGDRGISLSVSNSFDVFVVSDTYDATTGDYNYVLLKYAGSTGNLIWEQTFNGAASKSDRPVGLGLNPAGDVIVGGWSDMWTSGAQDYDYYGVSYDSGMLNRPTDLTATASAVDEVTLGWEDNSSNEDNFEIERRTLPSGSWGLIRTEPAGTTGYVDDTVAASTEYIYRVRATNAADGESDYSNEAFVSTSSATFAASDWIYTFNGTYDGDDFVEGVAVGYDNHPVVIGSTTWDSQLDYLTIKVDRSTGIEQWTAREDVEWAAETDKGKTIAVDTNNEIIVSGYTYQGISVRNDIHTMKYPSSGGDETWGIGYNGPLSDDDRAVAVAISPDGSGYVVAGYGRNSSLNNDIYLLKYTTAGVLDWAATPYDGTGLGEDQATALSIDSSGDIYVVGWTTGSSNIDIYTARYNGSTGAPVWTEVHPGAGVGDDFGYAVSHGYLSVCVSGKTRMATGDDDIITICYDKSDGTLLWDPTWDGAASGNDDAVGVAIDPFNADVIVTGTSLAGAGNGELTAIRYDSDGNLLWEKTAGRPDFDDRAVVAALGPAGNIYIGGDTNDGSGFDAIAVIFDEFGSIIGGTTVDGVAGSEDRVTSLAVSNRGEAFFGGKTRNSGNNYDYLLFRIHHNLLRAAAPLVATPDYRGISLQWGDNSPDEEGFYLERKDGACDSASQWQLIYTAPANVDNYNDLGMPVDTPYCYRVTTYKDGGATVSRPAIVETGTLLPLPPTDVIATAANTTTIDLEWTDNTNGEEAFRVQRCEGSGCSVFADLDIASANATTYQDTTACHNTEYSYQVQAYMTGTYDWTSAYSAPASDTTPAALAPTGVSATRISEAQIDLGWTDTTNDETGFRIERCEGSGCDVFSEVDTVVADELTYSDMTTVPGALHRYQVASYKTATCGWQLPSSPPVEETATIDEPISLAGSVIDTTTIDLVWTDRTASETGFEIWRCAGSGCTPNTLVDTTEVDATLYRDISACESTTYRYAVRATGGIDPDFWWSNYSNITADLTTNTPITPSGLSATMVSESTIHLAWTDTNVDETGFSIQRCEGAGCIDFAEINTVYPDTYEYDDIGVTPDTTYRYQVVAQKTSLCPWERTTNIAEAISDSPSVPTNLVAWAAHTTQVDLTWDDNTGSETGFTVERCEGSGCSVFVPIGTTGPSENLFSDETACHSTTYRYRVKAVNEGLSNNGGGCWTNRAPLTIDDFEPNAVIEVVVAYTAAMQTDFDDVRFFDETAGLELGFWIKEKADGVSSTFWVKVRSNNDINMYYSNPSATSSSDAVNASLELVDDFRGDTIDVAKWEEIDPDSSFEQNDDLILSDVAENWDKALISQQSIIRAAGKTIYVELTTGTDTDGNNNFMIGWEFDQTTNPSYTQLVHSFYWNNGYVTTYEKSDHTGPRNQSYAWSTRYDMMVKLKSVGAFYYVRGGAYMEWTLVQETSDYSDAALRVGIVQQAHEADIHFIAVTGGDLLTATIGAEETSGCFTFGGTWETDYSNVAEDITPAPDTPTNLVATGFSESVVRLTWDYTSSGETGFEIEMCEGVGCTVMSYVDTADPDTITFDVDELNPETHYRFAIRAVSTASCPWQTGYSNIADGDTLGPAAPTDLVATPIHTTRIDLAWTANTNAETNFELQRCEGTGCTDFTDLDTSVPPGTVTYSDTTVCDGVTYRYQIRAVRADAPTWQTPWSEADEATAYPHDVPTNLIATWVSEVAMSLAWTDNSSAEEGFQEDGFEVGACFGVGCSNFAVVGTTLTDETTLDLIDLFPGETYSFRVRATRAASCSWNAVWNDPVTTVDATILEPTDFTATAADTTTVALTWTDRTVSETGFTVERCEGISCDFSSSVTFDADPNDETQSATVSFSDPDACQNTAYTYRVQAKGISGGGDWTSPWSGTSQDTTPAMVAPSDFSASVLTDIEVTLEWTDNTADETGFKFERCEGQGCSTFVEIPVSVGEDVETYIDNNGVLPQTWYTYRVKAFKTVTCSWETVTSGTSTVFTSSTAPGSLVATAINSQVIQLDWVDLSSDEDGFHVEKQIWNGSYVLIASVGAGITTYTDNTGIEGDKEYTYRVRAYRGPDPSSYAYGSVTTPPWQATHHTCL
ncbi:MAG: DUF2341 domain-containing protein [Deltaproteobacteria bacterium]|nr:DUF2341 domain-containing protein [Deltaproteobacteria bacterium]